MKKSMLARDGKWKAAALAAVALLAGCDQAASPKEQASAQASTAVVVDAATGLRWLRCGVVTMAWSTRPSRSN